ncbi:hypothetical protein [Pseudomonas brassicacearum]|uniref:hypothetical protein n=1 Tax=Pseudomonas brassicacearum TaxID=930166 RepID=UPI0011CE4706|nr:hypothetical protein [Pseudomonas brassicacearum]
MELNNRQHNPHIKRICTPEISDVIGISHNTAPLFFALPPVGIWIVLELSEMDRSGLRLNDSVLQLILSDAWSQGRVAKSKVASM